MLKKLHDGQQAEDHTEGDRHDSSWLLRQHQDKARITTASMGMRTNAASLS
jgi:hypothetical protein